MKTQRIYAERGATACTKVTLAWLQSQQWNFLTFILFGYKELCFHGIAISSIWLFQTSCSQDRLHEISYLVMLGSALYLVVHRNDSRFVITWLPEERLELMGVLCV
jgi:hypothetical protein